MKTGRAFKLIMVAVLLVGCGNDSSPTKPAPRDTKTTAPAPTTPSTGDEARAEEAHQPEQQKLLDETAHDFVQYPGRRQRSHREPFDLGWSIVPLSFDRYVGNFSASSVSQKSTFLRDAYIENYLNELAQRLNAASHVKEKFPIRVRVINSDIVNAFAMPGGNVFFFTGLLKAADNEAQLAGVMAHEISHVNLRHGSKKLAAELGLTALAAVALAAVNMGGNRRRSSGIVRDNLIIMSTYLLSMKFSRSAEEQADKFGTQMLYDSGIHPMGIGDFFAKNMKTNAPGWTQWISTHPIPQNRVEAAQKEVQSLGGLHGSFKVDSPEFREMQRRLSGQ